MKAVFSLMLLLFCVGAMAGEEQEAATKWLTTVDAGHYPKRWQMATPHYKGYASEKGS